MNWKEIDTYAKQWIKEAGKRIRDSFDLELTVETKSNANDLVTNMDRATEEFFYEKVNKQFPDHRILGEEGIGSEITDLKGVVWIIDPIDGTINFVHQQRNFAISIGIFADGVGKIGLIYDVVHDELYHSFKGEGAYMNEVKLPPLKPVPVKETILAINASWIHSNKLVPKEKLISLVSDVRGTRSTGSAALELAYVAAGRYDAYVTLRLSPWDYAAGILLVEEVGGEVTDVFGDKIDFLKKSSIFASKPGLHQDMIDTYFTKE
ncbi:myo-inositol-1(or 4)-monophosphatase [Peribacillus deserti]|uniref:inositol-phosphate phosphatase n=1 Tax=Peribacillus deserti TaxID=673318 RepID=A0ABS2QI75_9BACI|nr:inositol monophosphatase family protein [Peribacillus deserti]MBM7692419.1 myo-inositol-1(or 4)-monophosphatase [Peribacillus deserti]